MLRRALLLMGLLSAPLAHAGAVAGSVPSPPQEVRVRSGYSKRTVLPPFDRDAMTPGERRLLGRFERVLARGGQLFLLVGEPGQGGWGCERWLVEVDRSTTPRSIELVQRGSRGGVTRQVNHGLRWDPKEGALHVTGAGWQELQADGTGVGGGSGGCDQELAVRPEGDRLRVGDGVWYLDATACRTARMSRGASALSTPLPCPP
jgi:hypothetical protein